jgi:hypothetical protein
LPVIVSVQHYAVVQHSIADIKQSTNNAVEHVVAKAAGAGGVGALPLPGALPAVTLPISVKLAPIPPVPILHGLLGA